VAKGWRKVNAPARGISLKAAKLLHSCHAPDLPRQPRDGRSIATIASRSHRNGAAMDP